MKPYKRSGQPGWETAWTARRLAFERRWRGSDDWEPCRRLDVVNAVGNRGLNIVSGGMEMVSAHGTHYRRRKQEE